MRQNRESPGHPTLTNAGVPIVALKTGGSSPGRRPKLGSNSPRSQSVAALVLAVLMMIGLVPTASAAATSVEFTQDVQATPPGQPFANALAVTVADESGPVEGVEVTFSVEADSTGATVQLSATSVLTDASGTARVDATAGTAPGFPRVRATVEGASATTQLVVRPSGYLPGERLAHIEALDQNGQAQAIGGRLKGKQPYLLIDVCTGWCGPCGYFARETERAITQLALLGIDVRLVTLLAEGATPWSASDQQDATRWATSHGLTGPVLHADSSHQSQLYRSAFFFGFGPGEPVGWPTHLLVDPKGTILDRRVGAETTDQTIARVLEHAKAKKPRKARTTFVGEVGVGLPSGQSFSHRFSEFGWESLDWGFVLLDGSDSSNQITRRWGYQTPDAAPLAEHGLLDLSLTRPRPDHRQRLATSMVQVEASMLSGDLADPDNLVVVSASTTLPATQRGDTVTVPIDLVELRSAIRTELHEGRFQVVYRGPLSDDPTEAMDQMIDELVASMPLVQVQAEYLP
jgi:hypothetical protein